MNVYDFDKTIYPKDSTLEFYLVSLVRHPSFLLDLPASVILKRNPSGSGQSASTVFLTTTRKSAAPMMW